MPMPAGSLTPASVVTDWRADYITAAVGALVLIGYVRTRLKARRDRISWPVRRDVVFGVGMLAVAWTSCGFPEARSGQLMWVWTTQQLVLLLIVPVIVLSGQPVALVRAVSGAGSWLLRALRSGPLAILGHPLIGPLLVPLICFLLFFSGLGEAAAQSVIVAGLLHLALLLVGCLIVFPLLDADDQRSSLAVGLALGVGFVELILDAFPGIILRFQTHLTIAHFGTDRPAWSGGWLDDQHIAGGILWVVAETLDLPFLVLAATRWIRADAREAARIDAELDARQSLGEDGADRATDRPWWLDDPSMRRRYRG